MIELTMSVIIGTRKVQVPGYTLLVSWCFGSSQPQRVRPISGLKKKVYLLVIYKGQCKKRST